MKRAFATVSLIGLCLIPLVGCGSGRDNSTNSSIPTLPQGSDLRAMILTSDDVNSVPADSPTRTLYNWWRAVQFRDFPGAKQEYAKDVDVSNLENEVQSLPTPLSASRPTVIDTNLTGRAAKLYTIVQTLPLGPTGQVRAGATRAVETPVVFRLVKEGDAWKLADNSYIDQRYRAQQAAAAQARAQASGPG
jgi:hypothetical protein